MVSREALNASTFGSINKYAIRIEREKCRVFILPLDQSDVKLDVVGVKRRNIRLLVLLSIPELYLSVMDYLIFELCLHKKITNKCLWFFGE